MAEVTNRPEFFAGQSNDPIASVCPMFPNVFVVSLGSTSDHSFFLLDFTTQARKKEVLNENGFTATRVRL